MSATRKPTVFHVQREHREGFFLISDEYVSVSCITIGKLSPMALGVLLKLAVGCSQTIEKVKAGELDKAVMDECRSHGFLFWFKTEYSTEYYFFTTPKTEGYAQARHAETMKAGNVEAEVAP